MKNKNALVFGIIAVVLLIAGIFVTWKWMSLRKSVAKVATNTTTPTSSATIAAISAVQSQAALI